jgi:hypothetical protein
MRMENVTSAENKTGKRGAGERYILSLCVCRMSGTNVRDDEMSGKMVGDV